MCWTSTMWYLLASSPSRMNVRHTSRMTQLSVPNGFTTLPGKWDKTEIATIASHYIIAPPIVRGIGLGWLQLLVPKIVPWVSWAFLGWGSAQYLSRTIIGAIRPYWLHWICVWLWPAGFLYLFFTVFLPICLLIHALYSNVVVFCCFFIFLDCRYLEIATCGFGRGRWTRIARLPRPLLLCSFGNTGSNMSGLVHDGVMPFYLFLCFIMPGVCTF